MIPSQTAQIARYAGFFFILLVFLPFDVAFTVSLSFYLAVNSKKYTKLVIASIVIFIVDILFHRFDISIRFISDLTIDSYVLMLTSLFIYLKSQQKVLLFLQRLAGRGRKLLSWHTLTIIGVSSIFALLLAPIIGIPFAVIGGYIAFSYLTKHFEGRYAYVAGLFFLFFSPFFIIAKRDDLSESFAIISFYFLIIGTIQEIIRLIQRKEELTNKIKTSGSSAILHSIPSIRLPKNKMIKFIFIASIAGILSFTITYFGILSR